MVQGREYDRSSMLGRARIRMMAMRTEGLDDKDRRNSM
jgi:hypothetical protein